MTIRFITPILYSSDIDRSVAYFTEKLGFTSLWGYEEPSTFSAVGRDGIEIFFSLNSQGAPGTWLMVWVKDVDAFHNDLQSAGAIIKMPPTDQPWNVREMQVECPDGHTLRFATETK